MTVANTSRGTATGTAPAPSIWQYLRNHPNIVRAISLIIFFVVWEFWAAEANRLFLATPVEIYHFAVKIFSNGVFWKIFGESMEHFLIGTALSIVAGIIIGVVIGLWWQAEYVLDPFINGFYAIPKPALVPLFILWMGHETICKSVIIISVAIFPVIINTYSGIKDTRGSTLEVGRAFGATDRQIFFKIMLPGAIPYVMVGIRQSVALGIIGMVIAEFFTSMVGFGGLVRDAADRFDTPDMYFAIIVIGAFGILTTEALAVIERRISRWRTLEAQRAQG